MELNAHILLQLGVIERMHHEFASPHVDPRDGDTH